MTEMNDVDKAQLVIETKFAPKEVMVANAERRIKQYVGIRDAIKAMKDKHDKELEPLVEIQDKLTGIIQECLVAVGAESIKTSEGTAYTTTRYTASLQDPAAFMDFVISNQNFDLLDRKANSTAVRDYVAEQGSLPPGVNLSSIATIGVRRASGK